MYLLSLKESPCAGSELRRYSYSLCFRRAPPGGAWKSGATSRRVSVVKNRSHRNRNKTARYRAKLKAKHRRTRLRRSRGGRSTYR